jgi:hypothetical protein
MSHPIHSDLGHSSRLIREGLASARLAVSSVAARSEAAA